MSDLDLVRYFVYGLIWTHIQIFLEGLIQIHKQISLKSQIHICFNTTRICNSDYIYKESHPYCYQIC